MKSSEFENILTSILNNELPPKWWMQSFLLRDKNLSDFMKYLTMKLEAIKILIEDRKCKIYPVI